MAVADMAKRNLKGSPTRDAFKRWHKEGHASNYGADADLMLIEKQPAGIVAVLDYKPDDRRGCITFAEAIAYNDFLDRGIPVFIVIAKEPFRRLSVYQYMGGNWKPNPPTVTLQPVLQFGTPEQYWEWESGIRAEYRERGAA